MTEKENKTLIRSTPTKKKEHNIHLKNDYLNNYARRLYMSSLSKCHMENNGSKTLHDLYFELYRETLIQTDGQYKDDDFLIEFEKRVLAFESLQSPSQNLSDFINLQINIRQLDILMECDKDINRVTQYCELEQEYFRITQKTANFPIAKHIIDSVLTNLLIKCEPTIKTIQYKKTQQVLNRTFQYVRSVLQEISLNNDLIPLTKDSTKFFENAQKESLEHFDKFALFVADSFLNHRKKSWTKHKNNYLFFITESEKRNVKLNNKNVTIYYDTFLALYLSYRINIFFKYMFNVKRKAIEDYLTELKINNDVEKYNEISLYYHLRLTIRKSFKHLPLIFFGLEMGLNSNYIKNLALKIDNHNSKKNVINNNNLIRLFNIIRAENYRYAFLETKIIDSKFEDFKSPFSS